MNLGRRFVDNFQGAGKEAEEVFNQEGKEKRRIVGHVEEEDFCKMKRRSLVRLVLGGGAVGTFEAYGENARHLIDREKVTLLVTTNQVNIIKEVVEIEVGNMVYNVHVMEIGFTEKSGDFQSSKTKQNIGNTEAKQG
ncbi:hypothetical protein V6N13_033375 [Hibiscus sabdariffa]